MKSSKYIFILFTLITELLSLINSENSVDKSIFCPNDILHKISIKSICLYHANPNPVSCSDTIKPNTRAFISCQYGYENSEFASQVIKCEENGKWSEPPMECKDVCAANSFEDAKQYIGSKVEYTLAQVPWSVVILKPLKDDFFAACSGIILNAKIVLARYRCLEEQGDSELSVVAGKYKVGTSVAQSQHVQFTKVKNVYRNLAYTRTSDYYYYPAASIIELEKYFIYNPFVRPACLDLSSATEEIFKSNPLGTYSRYGSVKGCGADLLDYDLEVNTVQIISNYSNCVPEKPRMPVDMFCFKEQSNESDRTCFSPSGPGIFIPIPDKNKKTKFVLIGYEVTTLWYDYVPPKATIVGSFVSFFDQKDFIMEYVDKFKSSSILDDTYENRPCSSQSLVSQTFDAVCILNKQKVSCQQPLQPRTIAIIRCKNGYQRPSESTPDEIQCLGKGKWSHNPYECKRTCGIVDSKSNTSPLIFRGKSTDITEIPWQVALYQRKNTQDEDYQQICGGTIVHSKIVITAAHCFWDPNLNDVNDKSLYMVAAGKRNRKYDASERQRVQFCRISEINVPRTFNENGYRHDIAILILQETLQFNSFTKPACIDWYPYGSYDIEVNVTGRVAGWGATSQQITSSNVLQAIEVVTLSHEHCKRLAGPNLRSEITGEKFCALGQQGETVCAGDSGGGFLIPKLDLDGTKRYYLWGVVSTGVNQAEYCTENFLTTYTNLQYHQDIIRGSISKFTDF